MEPQRRFPKLLLAWTAVLTGLVCALLVVFLVAHKRGWIGPVAGLTYETTLGLNAVLYWLMLLSLIALWSYRRQVAVALGRQWPQVLLSAISLLVSVAVVEFALRTLRPDLAALPFERWPSATLHHRNAPGRSSLGMGGQRVRTNADGFRTHYDRRSFREYQQRVVLLGDSYAFGLGVNEEDGVASVLEEKLSERQLSVAVLNTGVISYSPYLQRAAFHEVARHYEPTLTILLLDLNDIGDDHQYRRENTSDDSSDLAFDVPEVASRDSLCARLAICRALEPLWDRLRKPAQVLSKMRGSSDDAYDYYDFEAEVAGQVERNRFFVLRHPLSDTRPYFEFTLSNLEAIARDVQAEGSDFLLVVLPRYFHWDDSEAPNNWERERYAVDEPHEDVYLEFFDEAANRVDFPVWSLLPAFRGAEHGPLVFDHDPHWNAAGHRVAGETLAAWLFEAGWPASVARAPARYSFGTPPAKDQLSRPEAPEDAVIDRGSLRGSHGE